MFNSRKVRGFTLLELMLASTMLIVAVCGLLASYVTCFDLIETAKNMTLATNAIQFKLEEIRDYDFGEIAAEYDNTTFTVSGFANGQAIGAVAVENITADLLRVTVSVCWRQRGNRIIGEDNGRGGGIALSGHPEGTEDRDADGIVDSPAMISTLMIKRGT
jgi:type II secretory pathway pseudopilin PulG